MVRWLAVCTSLLSFQIVLGQPAWQALNRLPEDRPAADVWIRPQRFHAFALNHAAVQAILGRARPELLQTLADSPAVIALPMPDGSLARFRFVESPVMAPELAAKFPEIKTYRGAGLDDPAASVRFDLTPAGFHAQILSPRGAVYVDPAFRHDNRLHTSYYKHDYWRTTDFQCYTPSGQTLSRSSLASPNLAGSGSNLRTYRLAVAATAEYTAYQGGTVPAGMSAIVTAVNRVTGVYEADLAIRLVLVANNDLIVYTNASTDPYSNNNASSLLSQNQANLDSVIGSANYDIGHVFSTAGGGLAAVGVVCRSGSKAQGETGTSTPTGDGFYIDYVAHEMGHQFGANHTFNSTTSNCGGGNRNAATAYEQGSGSTIMAYAGICGSDNLQPHSDPYFHSISYDEIIAYSTTGSGNGCAVLTSTGNNPPTVSAGANYSVPQNTPFTLTAAGSDPDGDPLTYCWEERDLGPSTTVTTPDNGSSPLFRSWNPTTDSSRTFPRLQDLLNNALAVGEIMPTTTRTMTFRVTARDNRSGGGGVNTADMQVSVVSSAGPFTVTFPNSAGTLSGAQTVTWNVAGTTSAPINCANVNILLSTNGGLTFPITLAATTPNDGSQTVVLPNINTTTARIKIQAADNIFFDLSHANFTIVPGVPAPSVTLDSTSLAAESCLSTNNAIDPGETVTVNFLLKNIGSANTTNLVVTLLATNGVTSPGLPQNYGVLTAGGGAVARSFTFTASGTCGGAITAMLQLQDGAANLGTLSQTFSLGAVAATTITLTNAAAIAIPATGTKGPASPYPSTISVSGVTGAVTKVTVTLAGLGHTRPSDIDIVLVGPTGQTLMLMSDAGGANTISGVTLNFDDTAPGSLPTTQIVSGTFKPTNYDTTSDSMSSPAPAGPYGQTLSVFNNLDPNGTWQLYVDDDSSQRTGSMAQGWALAITTLNATCCQGSVSAADLALGETAFPTAPNVSSNVTFTLTVTNLGPDTASNVTVTDALPAGLSFISANSTLGTPVNNAGIVTCALGNMSNNANATITIQTAATTSGLKTNSASVASATLDPNNANNTRSMTVAVNSIPTIAGLTNSLTLENMPLGPLAFTVGDAETPASSLTLTLACSDTNLVPLANIILGGGGTNRTLTITPATNQSGSATITITVSDGQAAASDSFVLTVVPQLVITAINVSNDVVTVTWNSLTGQVYRLEYLTNLDNTNWSAVSSDVTASGPTARQSDSSALEAQRFYRVMLVP